MGSLNLSRDLADWLKMQSITYVGGDPFAEFLFEKIGRDYLQRCGNYFSACSMTGVENASNYPAFEDWLGRYSPDGQYFRDLLEKGAVSNLTPFGISDLERCK
jgi:hypothetical protein